MRDRSISRLSPASADDQSGRWPVRLILFGIVAVVAVAFGFLAFSVNQSRILVQRYGYYTMAITFAWAVVAVVRIGPAWVRSWPRVTRKECWAVTATIVGLTAIAVITVPYTYKVLYDEFVLQATAWCLHEAREVGAIVRGYEIDGVFTTLQNYLDKRPFFFTFLVSLMHDVTGYREANAFALNTVLMPAILGLVYLLARRLAAHGAALAAVCALGALSLLAQNATGAGMEMLNLAMLLLVMHLALVYLDAPDELRLSAFVLCTVLLAQARYESSLYVAPAALVIIEGWRRQGGLILSAAAVLSPALLIPYALHNTYLSGTPLLWELRAGEDTRFGLDYLPDNLLHAFQFFFSFSGRLTNSWWLGVAGLPAAIWALTVAIRHGRRWRYAKPAAVVLVIFGGAIVANLGLLMFYYWGQLDDAIVSRLSLPCSVLLALCLAWVIQQLPVRLRAKGARLAVAGALFSYLGSGMVGNATHWSLNQMAREIAWEVETVQERKLSTPLVLTNKSALIWLTNKLPAVQIVRALDRIDEIAFHLEHHTFSEVLVTQTYRPVGIRGGFQLEPFDRLPDSFVLEPIIERRFGINISRISRVVEIIPTAESVNQDARTGAADVEILPEAMSGERL